MTDTWTLPMTADEICEMYRTAKSRAKQVGILAELNATSKERIVEILTVAGYKVDGRATRYLKAEGSDTSSVSLAADTFPSRGRPRGERADAEGSDTSSVSLSADTFPSRGRPRGERAVEDAGPYDGGEAADTHTHTHTHTHRGRRRRSRSRWGGCCWPWRRYPRRVSC